MMRKEVGMIDMERVVQKMLQVMISEIRHLDKVDHLCLMVLTSTSTLDIIQ
jgi:hypothetical protein